LLAPDLFCANSDGRLATNGSSFEPPTARGPDLPLAGSESKCVPRITFGTCSHEAQVYLPGQTSADQAENSSEITDRPINHLWTLEASYDTEDSFGQRNPWGHGSAISVPGSAGNFWPLRNKLKPNLLAQTTLGRRLSTPHWGFSTKRTALFTEPLPERRGGSGKFEKFEVSEPRTRFALPKHRRWATSLCCCRLARWFLFCAILFIGVISAPNRAFSQAQSHLVLPRVSRLEAITVSAAHASWWSEGASEVWILRGGVALIQGEHQVTAAQGVAWVYRRHAGDFRPDQVHIYFEEQVNVRQKVGNRWTSVSDTQWEHVYETVAGVEMRPATIGATTDQDHALYQRALTARERWSENVVRPVGALQRWMDPPRAANASTLTSATRNAPAGHGEMVSPASSPEEAAQTRAARPLRLSVFPRSDVPVQFLWRRDEATGQWIGLVSSGVNLIISSGVGIGPWQPDVIDLATDRMVIWATGVEQPDLTGQIPLGEDTAIEIYMEGNIVFREGERVVYAQQMYYDVKRRVGLIVEGEVLTPIPDYEGLLRIRARVLRQLGRDRFVAENAFVTSSRMGFPGYRLQSGRLELEQSQELLVDPFTGQLILDPETGQPLTETRRELLARDNWIFFGPLPIFFWPNLATDLEEPSFLIRRFRLKNDEVFGVQVLTDWDMYELLGIRNRPPGSRWELSVDPMSERGLGHGTSFTYRGENFLGLVGPVTGLVDFWGIQDDGLDNLGLGRRSIAPEKDYRWRVLWQHRQLLPGDWQLTAEAAWISDRNFLEQYFEREWDELKDWTTGLELKRLSENRSLNLAVDYRVNNFFTQTDWLPRLDHFWLGQPILGQRLTWYERTSLGFARLRTTTVPEDISPQFAYRDWETSDGVTPLGQRDGERLLSRHEIDFPLQLGPFKCVPYAMGELGHWGEDRTGEDLQRAFGQVGVRLSLPLWRVDPFFESQLWNLHGLSHKVLLEGEFLYAEANRELRQLPLYDPLDDDAIESFRRRFPPTFGLPQLDERFYALRSGMAGWVTAPVPEIADDLMILRVGMRHRWQTKRGAPEARRIIDWLILDTQLSLFPKDDRDNFGEWVGLLEYDLRWQLGNRLCVLSEGQFDFFPEGQRVVVVGSTLDRPPNGSLYAGIHMLEGPISSTVLALAFNYRMSPKWLSSLSISFDLADGGNIGQNLSVTRIGESLLVSLGVSVDASRDNWGIGFAVEPRFLPRARLGRVGGAQIPPAGAYGLE